MSYVTTVAVANHPSVWTAVYGEGEVAIVYALPADAITFTPGVTTPLDVLAAIDAEVIAGTYRFMALDMTGSTSAVGSAADGPDGSFVYFPAIETPTTFTQLFVLTSRDGAEPDGLLAHIDSFTPFVINSGTDTVTVEWDNGPNRIYNTANGEVGTPVFTVNGEDGGEDPVNECVDALCVPEMKLTLGGTSMATPAWNVVDLWPLVFGRDYRTGDRHIHGVPGRESTPQRYDLNRYDLVLAVTGEVDPSGNPADDPREQFIRNLFTLRTSVSVGALISDSHGWTGGMIDAELEYVDGTVYEFEARVGPLQIPPGANERLVMGDGTKRWAVPIPLILEANVPIIV